jgi:hypothetical protein
MNNFIARPNIDHYLDLLSKDDTLPRNRTMITKLMLEEEDKLSQDLEQLEFAESRVASCRDRVDRLKQLRDGLAEGSTEHLRADGLVLSFEAILAQVERFCGHLRKKIEASKL